MSKRSISRLAVLSLLLLAATSCQRMSGSAWEDTKTIGRYIQRGSRILFKQGSDTKIAQDSEEFSGPTEDEFIPLNTADLKLANSKKTEKMQVSSKTEKIPPAPSEKSMPNIAAFKNPSKELATIFRTVHFNTDEHYLREKSDISVIQNITKYMISHPDLFIFVLGHCDERASEAYNLALGTRRANHIRTLLIKNGISADRVYTISFGKEMPLDPSHNKNAWAKNRRAEFKICEKNSTFMR